MLFNNPISSSISMLQVYTYIWIFSVTLQFYPTRLLKFIEFDKFYKMTNTVLFLYILLYFFIFHYISFSLYARHLKGCNYNNRTLLDTLPRSTAWNPIGIVHCNVGIAKHCLWGARQCSFPYYLILCKLFNSAIVCRKAKQLETMYNNRCFIINMH